MYIGWQVFHRLFYTQIVSHHTLAWLERFCRECEKMDSRACFSSPKLISGAAGLLQVVVVFAYYIASEYLPSEVLSLMGKSAATVAK